MKGKHIFLPLLLFLLMATDAMGQVKFGVRGGYNITDMSVSKEVLQTDNRNGFFLGPTLKCEFPLLGLGLDASVLYDQREAKVGEQQETTLTTKSVVVPVNLRKTFGDHSSLGLFVYAGPQIGFNLNDDEKVIDQARTWKYRESNFSVNLGGGLILFDWLQLSANYNVVCGRTADVTWTSARDAVEEELKSKSAKANAWQISAAVYF